MITMI